MNIVPRIQLGPRIDALVIYQGIKSKPDYAVLTEFCKHIRQLPLSIGTIEFVTTTEAKLVSACKPIVSCDVEEFGIGGRPAAKSIELIGNNQTCTSIRFGHFEGEFGSSSVITTFFKRLRKLETGSAFKILGYTQLPNLEHIRCIYVGLSVLDDLLDLISIKCPKLSSLKLNLFDDSGNLRRKDVRVGKQETSLSHIVGRIGNKVTSRVDTLGIYFWGDLEMKFNKRLEIVSKLDWSKLSHLRYLELGSAHAPREILHFEHYVKPHIPNIREATIC